jgi:glyoxylase-like metal-dependent hydrolase (beta-lactamase superfamily II)
VTTIETSRGTLTQIDGQYLRSGYGAAYLLTDGEEAAFFDNITRFSTPHLMAALEARGMASGQVRYILVSHCHLDHSAGTAELTKHCPEATVICHPRARRHLIDPTRLVQASRAVHGDAFDRLFGEIEPIDEARVRSVEEGERLELGGRALDILHTPGHAPHHLSVIDEANATAFTGDAYGLALRALQTGRLPYLGFVVSPGDFNPADARESIRKIRATGVRRAFVTHFGVVEAMDAAADQMFAKLDAYEAAAREASARSDFEGETLQRHAYEIVRDYAYGDLRRSGLDPDDLAIAGWVESETRISGIGLAWYIGKLRAAPTAG